MYMTHVLSVDAPIPNAIRRYPRTAVRFQSPTVRGWITSSILQPAAGWLAAEQRSVQITVADRLRRELRSVDIV